MLRTRNMPDSLRHGLGAPPRGNLYGALRAAALLLLVVSVLLGPAGFAGSAAWASAAKTCGVSCPCDDVGPSEYVGEDIHGHGDEHHGDAHAETESRDSHGDDTGHCGDADNGDDSEPCEDECPESCPNCGCCVGVAVAVLPLPMTSSATLWTSARTLVFADTLASGAGASVFRPPRSYC